MMRWMVSPPDMVKPPIVGIIDSDDPCAVPKSDTGSDQVVL
jgi:hypothetical protein